MATKKKLLQAAAGTAAAAGAGGLNIEDVFSTYLYEGNGYPNSNTQTITNSLDLSGEGGLTWIKKRDSGGTGTYSHLLFDTERGATKFVKSDSTDAQDTDANTLTSFNSDGFSIGTKWWVNDDGGDFASWTFRKAPKFFDVVTYTGNGSTQSISHNLGSVPGTIIIKRTDASANWVVFHRSLDSTNPWDYILSLNTTDARASEPLYFSSDPNDTTFSLGSYNIVNGSGASYVAYLFAHNDGDGDFGPTGDQDVIKCGSYTGNGADDGPEIDLGFEPQWLLVKSADQANKHWLIADVMRGWKASGEFARLRPHRSDAEDTTNLFRPTATGFKITATGSDANTSGGTYIYIAIRRGPMAVPTDATDVFAVDNTQVTTAPNFTSGFPVDFAFMKTTSGSNTNVMTRLMQGTLLRANLTDAEVTNALATFDHMDGHASWTNDPGRVSHMWRRAPSFFDVVAYTGTGVAGLQVSHNLGVAPEMMWVKRRDDANDWAVYHKDLNVDGDNAPETDYIILNQNYAASDRVYSWNDTAPTDTHFTLGTGGEVANNASGQQGIAYLFASVDGVSKVGSYTGNGSTLNIDCGFSSGARFVLIKRINGTGNWHVFDTERGIIAGDDPRLELDTTDAEDTDDDYLDPYSSGFTVNYDGTFTTSINASGSTYIFYAIA